MAERTSKSDVTCRYFLSNACRLGNTCTFSHERTGSRPDNVCRFYQLGQCNFGSRCRYDHVRPKPTPQKLSKEKPGTSSVQLKTAPILPPPKTSTSQLRPEAAEFVPKSSISAPISTYAGAVCGADSIVDNGEAAEDILCPYHIMGHCFYGDNCSYVHGNLCDLCVRPILHPSQPEQNVKHRRECMAEYEKEMEESFALAKSKEQSCGICMEVVMEKKEVSGRRFGILQNCKHAYCLECIRKWRVQDKAGSMEKEVVRTCPQCRVASDFVTPSSMWVEDEKEKQEMIEQYKGAMKSKSCKYFKSGKEECPFGNRCFYKHARPDGTLVEGDSPRTVRKRMLRAAQREQQRHPDTFVMWEFLQHYMGDDDDLSDDEDYWFGPDREDSWEAESVEDSALQAEMEDSLLQALQEELQFLTFTSTGSSRNQRNRIAQGSSSIPPSAMQSTTVRSNAGTQGCPHSPSSEDCFFTP